MFKINNINFCSRQAKRHNHKVIKIKFSKECFDEILFGDVSHWAIKSKKRCNLGKSLCLCVHFMFFEIIVQILPSRCTDLTWIKDVHICLKCNLVNFEIPKSFPLYRNPFGISKLTRLHFKLVSTFFIHVRSVKRQGKNRLTSGIYNMFRGNLIWTKVVTWPDLRWYGNGKAKHLLLDLQSALSFLHKPEVFSLF